MEDRTEETRGPAQFSHICSVLQILDGKWSFLIIALLSDGPKRFQQLHRDAAVIKTQSLTNALRLLEKNGIVFRAVFPTVPVSVEYSLTEKGRDFLTSLGEMQRWAEKWDANVGPRR
ncbi:winged helix-turn-helix transcriptional regulator [Paenibacillus sp. GCM10027627]|uniref:winged helix-turn-helix transcriptional regulator n=1 Tax=unclassified Paenibacillus TaxID=185978 RepID=UPI003636926A